MWQKYMSAALEEARRVDGRHTLSHTRDKDGAVQPAQVAKGDLFALRAEVGKRLEYLRPSRPHTTHGVKALNGGAVKVDQHLGRARQLLKEVPSNVVGNGQRCAPGRAGGERLNVGLTFAYADYCLCLLAQLV